MAASAEFSSKQALTCWAGDLESFNPLVHTKHTEAEREVVLCVMSPSDDKEKEEQNPLLWTKKNIFLPIGQHHRVFHVSPKSLGELEGAFCLLKEKNFRVIHVLFACHGMPIAIKPTNSIIQMPMDGEFAKNYFVRYSLMGRVPLPYEYESFDRFVEILRKGVAWAGKVTFFSCSTAIDVDQPERNITNAIASRLSGIEVRGTEIDLPMHIEKKCYEVVSTPDVVLVKEHFRTYCYNPRSKL